MSYGFATGLNNQYSGFIINDESKPLVSQEQKPRVTIVAEPKSILKKSFQPQDERQSQKEALPARSIQEITDELEVHFGDIQMNQKCSWLACLHCLDECWRGLCTGTQDEDWLKVFRGLAKELPGLTRSALQEKDGLEKLMTVWQFCIFIYALHYEHYSHKDRLVESRIFNEIDLLLRELTKGFLLLCGEDFLYECVKMDGLKSEKFCEMDGMSPVADYSSLPKKIKKYAQQNNHPNLPEFLRKMLQTPNNDDPQWASECLSILDFSLQERERFWHIGRAKQHPKVYQSVFSPPPASTVLGSYGCPRLPETSTCYIGALIHGFAHCGLGKRDTIPSESETPEVKIIQQIISDFWEICSLIKQKSGVDESRYFQFIKLLIYAHQVHGITLFERLTIPTDKLSELMMVWDVSRDTDYLKSIEMSGSPEFLSIFGRDILKLHKNPICSFVRNIAPDNADEASIRHHFSQWQFVLDVSVPEESSGNTMDIQDLIDAELAPEFMGGDSLEEHGNVLRAHTSELEVMIIHPKPQDSEARRLQTGDRLLRGFDDVIRMNFIDADSGEKVTLHFEKKSCTYYSEYINECTGNPGQNFTKSGHFQATTREQGSWLKFDDKTVSKMTDPVLGKTDHYFHCGIPVLYFYSLISPQEYQSRVVSFYKGQSELPASAFQSDGFEDIPLVDFSKK